MSEGTDGPASLGVYVGVYLVEGEVELIPSVV